MEILFENNYTRNKEWAKDSYRYICFKRPIMFVFFGFWIFYLLAGVYDSIVNKSLNPTLILTPLFFFFFVIFLYFTRVRLLIKRDLETHGKPIEVTVIVTDEVIKQQQSTGSEYQLNYSDIKKAVHTKNYIYLLSKTKLIYTLKKDSFSVGNSETFLIFLKNKGIKVK